MREIEGDFFSVRADIKLIPTNGVITQSGDLVMGGGVAKAFCDKFPRSAIKQQLGWHVKETGNVPGRICLNSWDAVGQPLFWSLPTKNHWRNASTAALIQASLRLLKKELDEHHPQATVAFPRLGCGLGGMEWEPEVRQLLSRELPEGRWVCVHLPAGFPN